ncbi:MAG: transporter substrate-binding domain-containing protein [Anaerolineae bacterium]|uniref:transporter substrate-binding domain-containing protein n=1 Tax=Promineifilum sp. TaxID=2664178 RepID=UPI001E11BE89|nr:transporter substrate-binding domain-containing protein [Anaerolineales bacterium]MCO5180139.1 transporter substrate-binding domain-containing protein [Promineifilum sp.]MCW5847497.1 transporter substrate-binding domain-containing protein [Anaerolineae bacterium]
MKRLIPVLLVLLAGVLAVAGCASGGGGGDLLSDIEERGILRVSTDPNYEPQSFLDANGEFVGFDIDVAREIAKRLGVEAEFVTPDWDIITAGNWAGQWDISVGSMTVTTARQQVLDFASPPYYYTPAQFAAADNSGIETLEDINGKPVCVGVSTTYETWLNGAAADLGLPAESFYADPPADITIVPLPTDAECPQSIQAGREDFQVFLTSNTVVQAAIDGGVPIHRVGSPVFSEDLAAAFDKSSELDVTTAVQRVGEIIQEMHDDGTLRELSLKWFDSDLSASPTQ